MFSRDFWRQQTAKSKHIFGKWCECVVSCVPLVEVFHHVHRVQVVRSCSLSLGVFRPFCPRLLSAFLLCLWCIVFEYGFISRFKGVFSAFWGADVCLYRLRVLRGLWGFCARV